MASTSRLQPRVFNNLQIAWMMQPHFKKLKRGRERYSFTIGYGSQDKRMTKTTFNQDFVPAKNQSFMQLRLQKDLSSFLPIL